MHWDQIEHKYTPRNNQKIAIDNAVEALSSVGFHGLLLDMAMGKTKVSLNTAEILKAYGMLYRVVIICPKGVRREWVQQIPEHSHIESVPYIWENKKTQKFQREVSNLLFEDFPILILSLSLFTRKNDNLRDYLQEFFNQPTLVILDESSKIKSVKTNTTPQLIEATKNAAYKMALTGTPWGESPLDIFAQMEFLKTGFWYKTEPQFKKSTLKRHWYIFEGRYGVFKELRLAEGRTVKTRVGHKRTEEIANKIRPYVTQQKKKDWLADLPEKQFAPLRVEMSTEQNKVYHQLKRDFLAEYGDQVITANNASVLTPLLQIAGGFVPKTGEPIGSPPGIEAVLDDLYEYSGKVILTAFYVAEIEGLYKALSKEYGAEQVCTYYGGTKDKEAELDRFQGPARFIILNPMSGAYGLNLQCASLMYNYSRVFSYEKNAQLEDRIHRPGQKNNCVYKDVIHTGTVQEKVYKAIQQKKDFSDTFDELTFKNLLTNV